MPEMSAILLSAGKSTRMGRLKALIPWQDATLIEYQVKSLLSAGVSEVVVVGGHRSDEVLSQVSEQVNVSVVYNPDYYQGKTTSIKLGLNNLSDESSGILVLAVDQPRPISLLRMLILAHFNAGKPITMPVYNGHSGHPILFSSSLLPELKQIAEESEGLRAISRKYRDEMNLVNVDSGIVNVDLNSPNDVANAKELFDSYNR